MEYRTLAFTSQKDLQAILDEYSRDNWEINFVHLSDEVDIDGLLILQKQQICGGRWIRLYGAAQNAKVNLQNAMNARVE